MFPGSIGYQELIVIAVVAVILFGGRLPEVARTIGQSYQQFRKGLSDLQSTFNSNVNYPDYDSKSSGLPDYSDVQDDRAEPVGPRFEPPQDEN
jgi:sec-independent protein translocase protein TatA